jgi:hypothetical protein
MRHGVNRAGCERRSSESGHAHGNRAKSLALLARVPTFVIGPSLRIGRFFTDRESRIAGLGETPHAKCESSPD